MSTQVASLYATLSMRQARFSRGIRAAISAVRTFGAVAGAVSGGGLAVLTARAFQNIDATAKTADKLGVATGALAGYRIAAERAGVTQQAFDTALQRSTRRIAEAAQGTGEARGALAELNLSAAELVNLSPEQQLARIADAFQQVGNQNDRVRLAFKLFDTEGVGVLNLLKEGSGELARWVDFADQAGVAISRVDAAKVEQANDAVANLQALFEGVGNQIAVRVAPLIEHTATQLTEMGLAGEGAGGLVARAFDQVITVVARLQDILDGLRGTFDALVGGINLGLSAITTGGLSEIFQANADAAFERSAEAFERIGLDRNRTELRGFFEGVTAAATETATATAAAASGVQAATRASRSAASARTRNAGTFDARFISVRGLSEQREQAVRVKQLDVTNRTLADIRNELSRGPRAVFT